MDHIVVYFLTVTVDIVPKQDIAVHKMSFLFCVIPLKRGKVGPFAELAV